ncbi:flagellar protein FliT [Pseudomonas sp. 5P_3.1_Bac2]|uniref:flagellar protein FliT n=1 Tax=Pseudomonas sp. 5P_3.1_Bac2 TaxID=2971617 RepID=UPI0021C6922C|nr:flagellar protein FliT [Pseudomonas sp. 5P_3.1_Bac2]MCU1716489.1 flagellar protein FliT [Pseudomonas sp. 5P_3.1_Bac2]
MNSSVQRLEQTGSAMRQAMASYDWAAIGELDMQCRQAVDDAMLDSPSDEATLRLRMQELLELYRELVSVCQNEKDRLASELLQMNQSSKAAKVYNLFG